MAAARLALDLRRHRSSLLKKKVALLLVIIGQRDAGLVKEHAHISDGILPE